MFEQLGLSQQEWALVSGIYNAFQNEGRRMDANESQFVLRQLTKFADRVYDVRYTSVKYPMLLPIPAFQSSDIGMSEYGWLVANKIGEYKILADSSTPDLPSIDADMEEKTTSIKLAGGRFGWSKDDMWKSVFANVGLSDNKAKATRHAAERFHDKITATGDANYGLKGLLSDQTSMSSLSATGAFSTLTAAQLLGDMRNLCSEPFKQAEGDFDVGVVVLPPAQYDLLRTKDVGTENDKSVLQRLQELYPSARFESWSRFKNVTLEGITAQDVAMAFPLDPEVGENLILAPFLMEPPRQDVNGNFNVATYSKTGGVIKRMPTLFAFMKGI